MLFRSQVDLVSTGIHKGDRDYQQDQVNLFSHSRIPGCMLGIVADGMGGLAPAAAHEPHSTLAAFLINPGGDCHWVHTGDSRMRSA